MSGYYDVEVLKIDKVAASVKMHVKVTTPDFWIDDSVGFGLHLLDNEKWETSLIGTEVCYEDMMNGDWCQKYANGFVKSVHKIDGPEEIPAVNEIYEDDPSFEPLDPFPTAIITIYCTDAAWLAHLSEGERWESYNIEVGGVYDTCEPIYYAPHTQKSDAKLDRSVAWMPLPSFLFERCSFALPKVVYFPKYTVSSYFVEEVVESTPDDHTELLKLNGKYVRDLENNETGILVFNDLEKGFYLMSLMIRGSRSTGVGGINGTKRLGKLTFNPNFNRPTTWLNYSDIFPCTSPVIKAVKRKGKFVTLTVMGIYDYDDLRRLNKARILKLISNHLLDSFCDLQLDKDFPLSKLLNYFFQEEVFPSLAIPKIADGIILNYSYAPPTEPLKDYNSMDFDTLVKYFEQEQWPCSKFKIELSDELFGLQLDDITHRVAPIDLSFGNDDGDIKVWKEPILWRDYRHLCE